MKLKRFEALTLQEALHAVKGEFGSEAVIVSTRRINKNRGLFGMLSQPMVEVTAAVDPAHNRGALGSSKAEVAVKTRPMKEQSGNAGGWYEPPGEGDKKHSPPFGEQLRVAQVIEPVSEQLSALREEMKCIRNGNEIAETLLHPLRQEIASIRTFVDQAMINQGVRRAYSLPPELRGYYEELVSRGVSAELSYLLVRSVVETLGHGGLGKTEMIAEILQDRLEKVVSVSGPLVTPGGLPKVAMFVGPTGVGKTTTIAKLASHFTQGPTRVKTVVITLDTYRVAAVEQLRTYARILKVPVEVVVTPEELAASITRHQDAGLILVDTTGRSPHDPAGHQEMAALAHLDVALETHLVLAAPTDGLVLQDVVSRYHTLSVQRLVFTKLDEARQVGSLFNLIHHSGLPVSYFSAGQRVPEDLEQATGRALVDLMDFSGIIASVTKAKSLVQAGAA